jgi:hypothetical protein
LPFCAAERPGKVCLAHSEQNLAAEQLGKVCLAHSEQTKISSLKGPRVTVSIARSFMIFTAQSLSEKVTLGLK